MTHPFEHIRDERRGKYFYGFLAGTVVIMLAMNLIGGSLTTTEAPNGIISFEFAGSAEKARAIIEAWGQEGLVRAAFVQGLDFLFPLAYAGAISMGCILAGGALKSRNWPLARVGGTLAWGIWLAAGLDYIENMALTALLFGAIETGWAMLAAICAGIKFLIIFAGMVYALYGLIIRLTISKSSE